MELAQWQDWERLANGVRHVRPRRRAYVRQDSDIHDAERRLAQGRYDEAQFLQRMAHITKTMVASLSGHRRQAVEAVAVGAAPQRRPAVPVMPPPALNQVSYAVFLFLTGRIFKNEESILSCREILFLRLVTLG